MKKVIIILIIAVSLTSCRSGWSCKKRYVENAVKEKQTTTLKTVKSYESNTKKNYIRVKTR